MICADWAVADRGLKEMITCDKCQRKILFKIIMTILDLKANEIAKETHVSNSLVSKYIVGERECKELDLLFIQKILGINFKEFVQGA